MPILDRDLFYAFGVDDPLGDFKSRLPPAAIMNGADISPLFGNIVATYPAAQTLNGARHTQAIAARTALTTGIPNYALHATDANQVGRFADMLSVRIGDAPALSWTDDGGKIVDDLGMDIVQQAGADLITKVPILGWIAQAGIFCAKLAIQLRKDMQLAKPKTYKDAILYDREADDSITAAIMATLDHGGELTHCFLPAVRVSEFTASNTITPFGSEGIALSPVGSERAGLGLVPGMAEAMSGIADVVQYPDKNVNGVGRGVVQTMGNLAPSASQTSLILWQAVTKNGPLAFQIDGDQIADAWEDYYDRLVWWAQTREDGEWADHHWLMVAQAARWAYYGSTAQTVSAIGKYFPERQTHAGLYPTAKCPSKSICVPQRYCQWKYRQGGRIYASRGGLVRYMVEQQWKAKLRYYLGTVTCAYVPRGAPALRKDPELAEYHEEMRALLLTHKARYKVDRDMVPDDGTGFREDHGRSVMAAGTDKLAAPNQRDIPEPKITKARIVQLDDVPPVDPALEGMPTLVPADPAVPGRPSDGDMLIGLLIAAGAGALLLGTLKGIK